MGLAAGRSAGHRCLARLPAAGVPSAAGLPQAPPSAPAPYLRRGPAVDLDEQRRQGAGWRLKVLRHGRQGADRGRAPSIALACGGCRAACMRAPQAPAVQRRGTAWGSICRPWSNPKQAQRARLVGGRIKIHESRQAAGGGELQRLGLGQVAGVHLCKGREGKEEEGRRDETSPSIMCCGARTLPSSMHAGSRGVPAEDQQHAAAPTVTAAERSTTCQSACLMLGSALALAASSSVTEIGCRALAAAAATRTRPSGAWQGAWGWRKGRTVKLKGQAWALLHPQRSGGPAQNSLPASLPRALPGWGQKTRRGRPKGWPAGRRCPPPARSGPACCLPAWDRCTQPGPGRWTARGRACGGQGQQGEGEGLLVEPVHAR